MNGTPPRSLAPKRVVLPPNFPRSLWIASQRMTMCRLMSNFSDPILAFDAAPASTPRSGAPIPPGAAICCSQCTASYAETCKTFRLPIALSTGERCSVNSARVGKNLLRTAAWPWRRRPGNCVSSPTPTRPSARSDDGLASMLHETGHLTATTRRARPSALETDS
jgi:hypothetical protein